MTKELDLREQLPLGLIEKKVTQTDLEDLLQFDTREFFENSDYPTEHQPPFLTLKEVEDALERKDIIYALYDQKEKMIAYYWFEEHKKENSLFVSSLVVARKYRDKGIGKYFLIKADHLANEKRLQKTNLVVDPLNGRGIHTYLKHGYLIKGFIRDYHGPNSNRLYMEKDLNTRSVFGDSVQEVLCSNDIKLDETTRNGWVGVTLNRDISGDNRKNSVVFKKPSS